MLTYLERQTTLTGRQRRIVLAAMLGDLLEFFDYYLIGYVVAFIAVPWQLTFGQSGFILLSSGFGAMAGAFLYGWLADRIGRRKVFILTVLNSSIATGLLALTPEHAWLYLAVMRFIAGIGVGGLYCVDLPLVQEFVPASKRGMISGLVTSTIPIGVLMASVLAATVTPYVGWRGLFAIGMAPGLLALLIRVWVPESPRWLLQMGRTEEARESLAWALEMDPADLPPPAPVAPKPPTPWVELFRYPRSLVVSWLANLGIQTGAYGFKLWAPTLVVQILAVSPQRAAFFMIWVNLGGLAGRITFSYLSDVIGRRASAALHAFGAAVMLIVAAWCHDVFLGTVSLFWLLMIVSEFFVDGGFAIIGPYSAEVWPASMRTTGMGSAYGFGGLGKVIGPLGLALIVGSSNVVSPRASLEAVVPAFAFLAVWFILAGVVMLGFARETRGASLEDIERDLERTSRSTS